MVRAGRTHVRIFHVSPADTVIIQGITISNGSGLGFNRGAGIWNDHSNLTLNSCSVTGNALDRQVDGGGIVNDASFSGSGASLTVNNSTISGNNLGATGTTNFGGGIYNLGLGGTATLTINNSTISGNRSFQGGGVFNNGGVPNSIAVLTINNSTFSGNYADQYAGAIMNEGNEGGQSIVTVTNSTFENNSSCNCNFFAGAIFNDGNTQGAGASLDVANSIFKAGVANPRNIDNQGGLVVSHGYNITHDAGVLNSNGGTGDLNAAGDQINTDPLLGALQDNGGPTFTHPPLPGSPAINAGDPNFTPPPFFDQRGAGFARIAGGRIDSGSFELQGGPTPTPTPCQATLYGSDNGGRLFTINIATGAGTLVGVLPVNQPTEIAYDPISERAIVQDGGFTFIGHEFNIRTGAGIGIDIDEGNNYTGFQWVGPVLYGTSMNTGSGPSSLRILDPWTGTSTLIGPTGVGRSRASPITQTPVSCTV